MNPAGASALLRFSCISTLFLVNILPALSVLPTPVLELAGDVRVVVLLDIHKSFTANGTCEELDFEVIQVGQTTIWTYDWLKNTSTLNTNPPISLEVYDTCGSPRVAMEILSRVVTEASPPQNRRLAGVISYTSEEVSRLTGSYLSAMGYLHISLPVPGMMIDDQLQSTTVHIPSPVTDRTQALSHLLKRFNWHQVDVVTTNDTQSTTEMLEFKRMAADHHICVVSSRTIDRIEDLLTLNHTTATVLAFTDYIPNDFTLPHPPWNYTAIVAGLVSLPLNLQANLSTTAGTLENMTVANQTNNAAGKLFFSLDADSQPEPFLLDFLSSTTTKPNSLQYLQTVLDCGNNPTSCKELINVYFDSGVRASSVGRGRNALLAMVEATNLIQANGCLDFRVKSCGIDVFNMSLSHAGITNTKQKQCSETSPVSLYTYGTDGQLQELDIAAIHSEHIPPSTCDGPSCSTCRTCNTEKAKSMKAAVKPGSVYIGGFFPMKDQEGQLLAESILTAEAFLWSLDYFQQDNINLSPNIHIGGFAMDNSQNLMPTDYLINGLESCGLTPSVRSAADHIQSITTSAYLNIPQENELLQIQPKSHLKPLTSISRNGLCGPGISSGKFWSERLADLLTSLQWTYPTILWSGLVRDSPLTQEFEMNLRHRNICIANSLEFSIEDNVWNDISGSKSDIIILMTSLEETERFIKYRLQNDSTHTHRFVFFPWNSKAIERIPNEAILGSVVIDFVGRHNLNFHQYLKQVPFSDKNINPWLQELYEAECLQTCDTTVNLVACWENFIDNQMSYLPSYIIDATETLVLSLAYGFQEECTKNNKACNFEELMQNNYDANKITFPLDIFNVQQPVNGTAIFKKVGRFDMDGKMEINVNYVMAYNANRELMPVKSVCKGWCPSCQQCGEPSVSLDRHHYTPGDVIVVGLFPIHTAGDRPDTCGSFNPQGYTDAEAFQYAIANVHSRYPDILPNITVGSLVLDTCGDPERTMRQTISLEGCRETYIHGKSVFNPSMVLGYVDSNDLSVLSPASSILKNFDRVVLNPSAPSDSLENPNVLHTTRPDHNIAEALISVLVRYNWTYVSVIASDEPQYRKHLTKFQSLASQKNICISKVYQITNSSESVKVAYDGLVQRGESYIVVTFLKGDRLSACFDYVKQKNMRRIWLNAVVDSDRRSKFSIPSLGSVSFESPKFSHTAFEEYLQDVVAMNRSHLPWNQEFGSLLEKSREATDQDLSAKIISSVDTLIHGFHDFHQTACDGQSSLCDNLSHFNRSGFMDRLLLATKKTRFLSDMGKVTTLEKRDCFIPDNKYNVMNVKKFTNGSYGAVQVAFWDGKLRPLDGEDFEFYDAFGYVRRDKVLSSCEGNCECVNPVASVKTMALSSPGLFGNFIFYPTKAEFIVEPWSIAVTVIAGTGVLVGFIVLCFIIAKLCVRSLKFKNADLGLLLLLSDVMLFLSVLPFVFSPSALSCQLQYLLPGLSFALCFGICLTKTMTTYEYTSVGLGGEVSRLNTFIILLFMVGVEVAIGVQFWMSHGYGGMLLTETTNEGFLLYACNLDKGTFLIHNSYVAFLLILCVLYSFALRDDRRNMSETRFLLTSSLLCVVAWIAFAAITFPKGREYFELLICLWVLLCATIIMLILFFPKLRHLNNPKNYNLQQEKTDNSSPAQKPRESAIEGPYSLPGTLTNKGKPVRNSVVALSSDFFY